MFIMVSRVVNREVMDLGRGDLTSELKFDKIKKT